MGLLSRAAQQAARAAETRQGLSLADMIYGSEMQGSGDLILKALRRARANFKDESLFEVPMPRRAVRVGSVRPTDGVPPEPYWVKEYVKANGDHNPIVVRRNALGGYSIIDGHHRLAAAKELGRGEIDALDASNYFGGGLLGYLRRGL